MVGNRIPCSSCGGCQVHEGLESQSRPPVTRKFVLDWLGDLLRDGGSSPCHRGGHAETPGKSHASAVRAAVQSPTRLNISQSKRYWLVEPSEYWHVDGIGKC